MQLFRLQKFQILKGIYYFSVFFLASGFSYVAFANPPGSAYAPGATLDPSCAPGSTNCTVSSTATASGSDGYLQFSTSGALASDSGIFWDNTTKRLGIGTVTPSAPLTVAGQIVAGYFTGTSTATSTFGGNLAISGTGTSTSNGGFDITAGCYAVNGTCIGAGSSTNSAGGTGAIQFASGTSFAADATNLFWADSTNRLGLGTATPAYTLDVNGDANIAAGSAYKYNGVNIATASTTLDNFFFGAAGNLTMTGGVNVALGRSALGSNTTGDSSTAIGANSMLFNTTGSHNIAIGRESLYSNASGNQNTAVGNYALHENTTGSYNASFGINSLYNNTTGSGNVALGYHSLQTSTSTNYNTAVGYESLNANTVGTENTALGYRSLYANTTGIQNAAVGYQSLSSNTTGYSNSALGYRSLSSNTTGAGNIAIGNEALSTNTSGNDNTAIGLFAMLSNTSGEANTAIGRSALSANSDGVGNTGIGYSTLSSNTSGISNVANGSNALRNNTTGSGNVALGYQSLYTSTSTDYLTAIGYQALYSNTVTGTGNQAVGYQSLYANTTGSSNTASGFRSLYNNTTGNNNTATGYWSMYFNTTGYSNSAYGNQALRNNTTGYDNTAVGNFAMIANDTGEGNTAIGLASLSTNTSGSANTAVGGNSLYSNTIGGNNSAFGQQTLYRNTTGGGNSGYGFGALFSNTTGNDNTATGVQSLFANETGSYNTASGYQSLFYSTGSDNTALGYHSGYGTLADHRSVVDTFATFIGSNATRDASVASTTVLTNITAIGKNATVGASNSLVLGGTGADAVKVGIGTTTPAYSLDVNGDANIAAGSAYRYNRANVIIASTTLDNYFFAGAGNLTMTGIRNTVVGAAAFGANTTGVGNAALGFSSLYSNTTGGNNVASGRAAMYANTTGNDNSAYGDAALFSNTTGVGSVAIGASALYSNVSGDYNIANGGASLYSNTTGTRNIATGIGALYYNVSGGYNIAFGDNAGVGASADNRSVVDERVIFLGYNSSRDSAVASTTALTNITAIGYNAKVGADNSMVLGGTGADAVKVGIGTTTPSQTLNVEQAGAGVVARFTNSSGYCDINPTTTALVCTSDATLKKDITSIGGALNYITALRGVTFNWLNETSGTPAHIGFVAQEVEQVLPSLVATDDVTGKKSVNYIGFTPVIIEAIKELTSRIIALETRLAQGVSAGITNVKDFVVETLTAKKVATDTLEMKDSATGETYCVKIANGEWDKTKGACATTATNNQASVIDSVYTPTAPVEIIMNGLNPQTVTTQSIWGDLGAIASSTDSHLVNYGITTFVDGVQMATPAIDTATSSVHTIEYKVIDGSTGTVYTTATRTVNVVDPTAD